MRQVIVLVAAMLPALAGCAMPQATPYIITQPFDESRLAWATKPGDSSIRGQAFLKTRGGDVKTCAGNAVRLLPVSPYTSEIYTAARGRLSDGGWSNRDPGLSRYVKRSTCDAQGYFSFKNLPAGEWFLQTSVLWEAPTPAGSGLMRQGGALLDTTVTKPGEQTELIMNGD